MSELGDLLERVFDPRFECVSARIATSVDIEGHRRVIGRHGGGMTFTAVGGDPDAPPPTTMDSVVDVWFHRDGRFRIDYGEGSSMIGDGVTQVMLRPGQPALRVEGSGSSRGRERLVIEPAVLLSSYRVEVDRSEEVAGRDAVVVRGRQRSDGADGPMRLAGSFPATEMAEFVFDRQTGVLLRLAGVDEGQTIATLAVSHIAFDDDVDLGAFDLPADLEVRTEAEELLQRLADEEVDTSGLDPTDVDAVREAFFAHHRAKHGFGGMLDPRAMHQPTGPPPEDEAGARAEITSVFEDMTARDADGGAVNIQGGGNLGPALDQAAERYPGTTTTKVTDVLFIDDRQAVVWFHVTVENGPSVAREGRALLIDDRWVVERQTMGSLLSMAGIAIPPPG